MPYKNKQDLIEYKKLYFLNNKHIIYKKHNLRKKIYKAELFKFVNNIKSKNGCSGCNITNPICLDFHHIDPNNKVDTISNLIRNQKPKNIIQQEIDKCIILCGNCHIIEECKKKENIYHKMLNGDRAKNIIRNIEFINSLKDKCSDCGLENKICLQFHHICDKKYNISYISYRNYSLDAIKKEIEKCVVLCVNCHRKTHK